MPRTSLFAAVLMLAIAAPSLSQGYLPGDAVTDGNPYPVKDTSGAAYNGSQPVAINTTVTPARAIAITCTVAGNVALILPDDSSLVLPMNVGLSILGLSVKRVSSSGTTATCSYASLK